jgi:hypothetical protein
LQLITEVENFQIMSPSYASLNLNYAHGATNKLKRNEDYMNIQEQIKVYIDSQPDPKRADIEALHQCILKMLPKCKLWFLDGKDDNGKIVTNPNIGYGQQTIKYADGKTKEFYQIGISANTTGISVYIIGINDKTYLPQTYGKKLGKARVTGYCIKFKKLKDINIDILETAIRDGVEQTTQFGVA